MKSAAKFSGYDCSGFPYRAMERDLMAVMLRERWLKKRPQPPVLDCPWRVVQRIPSSICESRKEHFLAFYLDARNHLVREETVSIGTLSASLVHPREVFSPAIAHAAAALIVAHNHPSGDCTPSPEDKDVTRRLQESGALLGIPLLDHLIVAAGGDFCSFRERGLLKEAGK
ncbi:MAG: DNA repair protein RadC [Elusimicrobia bacterium]|nr:DNA repair protein RadC [Elusimicrobiota bacterium]MDE2312996.1 DNA repair protein RadC [Elusimicrobiota bacterium]